MSKNEVRLDIRGLPLDQQTRVLREKYRELRGTGTVVRAQVDHQPARLYVSMLESGYRVAIEPDSSATILVLNPMVPRRGSEREVLIPSQRIPMAAYMPTPRKIASPSLTPPREECCATCASGTCLRIWSFLLMAHAFM